MMLLRRIVGAALLAATLPMATLPAAKAQPQIAQFAPYPYAYPPPPALAAPPSWSYDPYTSGLGPCPQHYPTDPPCKVTIDPSFGQPSYWPQP